MVDHAAHPVEVADSELRAELGLRVALVQGRKRSFFLDRAPAVWPEHFFPCRVSWRKKTATPSGWQRPNANSPTVKSAHAPRETRIARQPGCRAGTAFPGAGDKAVFESPKVAAHGDFACTAAMQLAKPLKQNPRQVAESLRSALLETPPFGAGSKPSTSPAPASSTSSSSPRPSSRSCTKCWRPAPAFGSQARRTGAR